MYLLDTNIVSQLVRHPQGVVQARIIAVGEDKVVTSIVVAGELRFGAERRGSPGLTARIETVLQLVPVLPLRDQADVRYGRLRAELERRGQVIGSNDMLIAAHALSIGATIVTDNAREFERVDGLTVENWLRPN